MTAPEVHVIRYRPGREVVANVGKSRVSARFSPDGRHVVWTCSNHGKGRQPGCPCSQALAATPVTAAPERKHP